MSLLLSTEWHEPGRDGEPPALKRLLIEQHGYQSNFRYSLLEVFPPHAPRAEVDRAENHYKTALLTKQFGLNLN